MGLGLAREHHEAEGVARDAAPVLEGSRSQVEPLELVRARELEQLPRVQGLAVLGDREVRVRVRVWVRVQVRVRAGVGARVTWLITRFSSRRRYLRSGLSASSPTKLAMHETPGEG